MRAATILTLTACTIFAFVPAIAKSPAPKPEKRCGYLSNPTPANWWLTDRDGEWIIGAQGGYQAEGLDTLSQDFLDKGWVYTNGWYGYRCACLSVTTNRKAMRIRRIYSGEALAMKRCTADKSIRRGE